jgi:hypothetical protein
MQFQRCSNSQCGRPFQINEFEGKEPGSNEPTELICPHCGHTEARWCDSVFLVHALTPEEEADFNVRNPTKS